MKDIFIVLSEKYIPYQNNSGEDKASIPAVFFCAMILPDIRLFFAENYIAEGGGIGEIAAGDDSLGLDVIIVAVDKHKYP